jgi:tungstate transport system substrate-binding protein
VIFVHAREREEAFVAEGYGTRRYPVMHNDFVIAGPTDDPAGIEGMEDVETALEKIAEQNAFFVSRGDDSGTHTKEQALWQAADVPLVTEEKEITKRGAAYTISFVHPEGLGKWYLSIGQGMGKTLTVAAEKQAYTLADRGTFLKYKLGRAMGLELEILCEGDPALANPYGIIPVNPKKFPHVRYELAKTFADWLTSKKGQSLIADYKIFGKQLFYPDAMDAD